MIHSMVPVLDMPKKPTPPPEADLATPSSETVRVAGDLVELLREIAFHSRDTRGKRMKLTQIVDNILRPGVLKMHGELQQETKSSRQPRPAKPET